MELLQDCTYAKVQSFATSLGAQSKLSKLNVTMSVKRFLSKDQERFKKAFSKLWGVDIILHVNEKALGIMRNCWVINQM